MNEYGDENQKKIRQGKWETRPWVSEVARQVAANSRRWWRNSAMLLISVLTIAWFDAMGLRRLS